MGNSSSVSEQELERIEFNFYNAARFGELKKANKILGKFPQYKSEIINSSEYCPVKQVILGGYSEFLQMLMNNSLDMNTKIDGRFPLFYYALMCSQPECARILYEAGADISRPYPDNGVSQVTLLLSYYSSLNQMRRVRNRSDAAIVLPEFAKKLAIVLAFHDGPLEFGNLVYAISTCPELAILFRLYSDQSFCEEQQRIKAAELAQSHKNPRLAELMLMSLEELHRQPEAISLLEKYPAELGNGSEPEYKDEDSSLSEAGNAILFSPRRHQPDDTDLKKEDSLSFSK